MSPQKLDRLSVNMNDETAASLRKQMAAQRRTATEVVRRALAITEFIDDELASGREPVTANPDGSGAREVVFL